MTILKIIFFYKFSFSKFDHFTVLTAIPIIFVVGSKIFKQVSKCDSNGIEVIYYTNINYQKISEIQPTLKNHPRLNESIADEQISDVKFCILEIFSFFEKLRTILPRFLHKSYFQTLKDVIFSQKICNLSKICKIAIFPAMDRI